MNVLQLLKTIEQMHKVFDFSDDNATVIGVGEANKYTRGEKGFLSVKIHKTELGTIVLYGNPNHVYLSVLGVEKV